MPDDAPDDVDQFEIKVNFGAAQIEKAMQVFGLDPDAGKDRRIWFGEITNGRDGREALPLLGRGVILRVRAKEDEGDVTLKLRGPDGCIDAGAWRDRTRGLDAKVEGDWAGRRLVSASLSADFDAAGDELDHPSLTALMSDAQRALARELLIPISAVELLGPIASRKWKVGDVEAERWVVDDLTFLEISVVTKKDPEKAQHRLEQHARDGGLKLEDDQEPKTTRVLRHLASP
jgi:hypothetical protein